MPTAEDYEAYRRSREEQGLPLSLGVKQVQAVRAVLESHAAKLAKDEHSPIAMLGGRGVRRGRPNPERFCTFCGKVMTDRELDEQNCCDSCYETVINAELE